MIAPATESTAAEPSTDARAFADDRAFAEIEDLAERCASYWRSVAEAAFRREPVAMAVPLRQARLVTREVVEIAATIFAEGADGGEGGGS